MQIAAFILQRPPEPLNHAVVTPRAFPVYYRQVICKITERHADLDLCVGQHVDPAPAGELAALIRIEYLRLSVLGQGFFQGLNAEFRIHAVRLPPGQHLSTIPVHDRHEIQEAAPHRDIRDADAPDLVGPVDHRVSQ